MAELRDFWQMAGPDLILCENICDHKSNSELTRNQKVSPNNASLFNTQLSWVFYQLIRALTFRIVTSLSYLKFIWSLFYINQIITGKVYSI